MRRLMVWLRPTRSRSLICLTISVLYTINKILIEIFRLTQENKYYWSFDAADTKLIIWVSQTISMIIVLFIT